MRKEKLEELKSYVEELKTIKVYKIEEPAEFLSIEKNCYELNNRRVIVREKVLKNGRDAHAAVILPITKEGNVVIVVQPRTATKETVGIELPAGYIEAGEEAEVAARRELLEEVGYVPREMKLLASYYQDQGCFGGFNHSFLALDCEKKGEQKLDKDEVIKYFECRYDEALELMEMGYIKDANSIIALEKSKQFVKKRGVV